jgi:hypothetical protein
VSSRDHHLRAMELTEESRALRAATRPAEGPNREALACLCGHAEASHKDHRDEWVCCSACPCLAFATERAATGTPPRPLPVTRTGKP